MNPNLFRAHFKSKFCCSNVRFTPFGENQLLLSTSQYFGIVGAGEIIVLQVLRISPDGNIVPISTMNLPECCLDACMSEGSPNHVLGCCGNGYFYLMDINNTEKPLFALKEHFADVTSCDWNSKNKNLFLTGSNDKLVKIWDIGKTSSVVTLAGHDDVVDEAKFHPTLEQIVGSCGKDNTFKIWDIRINQQVKSINAHMKEIMSFDFNKYQNIALTASADKTIKLWDLRATEKFPLRIFEGHILPVKRVKFSPFQKEIFISGSYDMTVKVWNTITQHPILSQFDHHTEFVTGIDFNIFKHNQIASCSWDKIASVYEINNGTAQHQF